MTETAPTPDSHDADQELSPLLQPEMERAAQSFVEIFGGTVEIQRTAVANLVRAELRRQYGRSMPILPDSEMRAAAVVQLAICRKLGGVSRGSQTIVPSREIRDRTKGKIYGKPN